MKNQTFKGVIAGTLAGVITVFSFPAIADSIEAVMNSVNIKLNGEKVASVNETYTLQNGTKVPYSILYEGTTYLPIRKVSELLDIDIDWDNDTRSVLIQDNSEETVVAEGYDSWYGAPDFGILNSIDELAQSPRVHSTTHWYEIKDVNDDHINNYVEQLEELGYERVTEGNIKPKFKVYKKGTTEVWLDLGMYKKLVYGITVMDSTRPLCSKEYSYSGANEDIPNFNSIFGYNATIIDGEHCIVGDWHLWGCLADYFCILEEEGFKISSSNNGFYGKSLTLKKNKSTFYIKFDGTELSTIPAIVIDY